MIRAVLWDLDGTLTDSEEYHWCAWREALAAEGVQITRQQFLATFGHRNDSVVPALLGRPVPPAEVARIGDSKERAYRQMVVNSGIEPLAGAAEWVKRLRAEGWSQAVASSAPRANIDCVLRAMRMDDLFNAIVSAEDVQHGKPDPEVFLAGASRLGADPCRTIVVEDAHAGVEAAHRAGMRCIGILGKSGGGAGADIVVHSLADLAPDAFDRLLSPAVNA
jgi:beta-phosphoglucomutase family hydrolase